MRQFAALETTQLPDKPVHLAIGMFDGVHRGHQAVIGAAVAAARAAGGLAGVLTFWPHPSVVLRPERPTPLLFPLEQKRVLLAELELDFLIEQPFTPEFAGVSAHDFTVRLKRILPGLQAVYIGENFRFGRGREGDAAVFAAEATAAGYEARVMPRLSFAGAPVSSSRLRELVVAGDIEQANAMLGYTYFCSGKVQSGRRLGRTIGFPTLNLAWEPGLLPRYGVYAVGVKDPAGRMLPGVANYGLRPTVELAARPLLEVHVLAETTLTYGAEVSVHWLRFLRPERKFSGVDELRAQIEIDRQIAGQLGPHLSVREIPNSA